MDGWIKMPLGTKAGLGPLYIVLHGGTRMPPLKGVQQSPQFHSSRTDAGKPASDVYCGKTVRWIKMPLGTKVGFCPGDIVSDRDQLPDEKRHSSPLTFRPISILTKRQDGTRYDLVRRMEVGSGDTVLDGDPVPRLHGKWHSLFMWYPPYFYFRFECRR